jgi:hypothetical protein
MWLFGQAHSVDNIVQLGTSGWLKGARCSSNRELQNYYAERAAVSRRLR